MFSTIARGMADLDPCFKVKLAEALDDWSLCKSDKFVSINLVIVSHLNFRRTIRAIHQVYS